MESTGHAGYSKIREEPLRSDFPDDGSVEELLSCKAESSSLLRFQKKHAQAITVHLLLISLYSLLALSIVVHSINRHKDGCSNGRAEHKYFFTPAHEGTSYEIVTTNVNGNPYEGKFIGNPGPAVDSAWQELLRPYNLRISRQDLEKLNRTSLPLADGSGNYWGSMEVYHHLHCLKAIRHYIAIDYYPEDTNNEMFLLEPGKVYPEHIEHCIEALRLHLICQPDTSVWTYEWHDDHPYTPWANHEVAHECVDWSKLENWAIQHSFSIHDRLVSWPNGTVYEP